MKQTIQGHRGATTAAPISLSFLGMPEAARREFEFLAGLSVKVIKPLLMHPFVVAASSSVTFIKYVQLNVTHRGSALSCS